MWHEQEATVLEVAPGASITVAQLYEVDWPVELRAPLQRANLADPWVDQNKRSWTKERVKRVVGQSDVTIKIMPNIQVLDESDWHLTPNLHHPGHQIRVINVK